MATRSVAVIGTGSIGAMALWQLACRGIKAVGYDRYAPGHDLGAAGGDSRLFRFAYHEGSQYDAALARARLLWSELERQSGRALFVPAGVATVGRHHAPVLVALGESVAVTGRNLELVSPTDARARWDFSIDDDEIVALDPQGGMLRAAEGVVAATEVATSLGAVVRRHTRVVGVDKHGAGVRVWTEDGTSDYDAAVLAPGPWIADLDILSGLRSRLGVVTSLWFAPRAGREFNARRNPAMVRLGSSAFSCFPAFDGSWTKVNPHERGAGGVAYNFPTVPSMAELNRKADPAVMARARDAVMHRLPALAADPVRTAVYADAFSPDGHGYLGPIDPAGRVLVGASFSGHGFKLAPCFGEVLAALAAGEPPAVDLDHLSPHRVAGSRS